MINFFVFVDNADGGDASDGRGNAKGSELALVGGVFLESDHVGRL